MKSERIPEHKLNVTTTVEKAIENMTNNRSTNAIASEKEHSTKSKRV